MNKIILVILFFVSVFTFSLTASAHSTVSPSQTATSKYENFTLSVPTEKEVPTTAVRLLVPEGVDRVTPFVKPGWTINTTKNEAGNVAQIEWTGGSVPAGQKDVFVFTARTASEDTTLVWKVYQTYQDGEVVAWDQDPKAGSSEHGGEVQNPYSTTEVKADASLISNETVTNEENKTIETYLPWVALIVSLIALWLSTKK